MSHFHFHDLFVQDGNYSDNSITSYPNNNSEKITKGIVSYITERLQELTDRFKIVTRIHYVRKIDLKNSTLSSLIKNKGITRFPALVYNNTDVILGIRSIIEYYEHILNPPNLNTLDSPDELRDFPYTISSSSSDEDDDDESEKTSITFTKAYNKMMAAREKTVPKNNANKRIRSGRDKKRIETRNPNSESDTDPQDVDDFYEF